MLSFEEAAWEQYLYWWQTDKAVFKRINTLIADIQRQPFEGKGKPELLKHRLSGYWSRRIDLEHRLVYKVTDSNILVVQCRHINELIDSRDEA